MDGDSTRPVTGPAGRRVDRVDPVVAGPRCRVRGAAGRVAQLEAELASARQPAKTPANSSVPPAQARKANRAERRGRKHGPERGHVGSSRRRQPPDQVLKIRPTVCGGCGEQLGPRDQRRVGKSQVIELPPVRPVVIEVWRYAAVCPACQHRTVAEAPGRAGAAPDFGPGSSADRVSARAAPPELRAAGGGVQGNCSGSSSAKAPSPTREGVPPSPSRAWPAGPADLRDDPGRDSRQPGDRVGRDRGAVQGRGWYECYVRNRTASFHTTVPTRAAQVLNEFLDGAVPEVWVSDLYAGQLRMPAGAHQICWPTNSATSNTRSKPMMCRAGSGRGLAVAIPAGHSVAPPARHAHAGPVCLPAGPADR